MRFCSVPFHTIKARGRVDKTGIRWLSETNKGKLVILTFTDP